MTLQSNVDPRLLNGLLPLSSCIDLSLQFVIMHLLIAACTQLHISSCYPHCSSHILFHCLGWFHSVWLFQGHNLGFIKVSFFYGDRLSVSCPTPKLEGQSTILITHGTGWLSYTPRALATHFGRLLQPTWAAVGLSSSPSPHGKNFKHTAQYFIY